MTDQVAAILDLLHSYPSLTLAAMFSLGFAYDFVWARWSRNVADHNAWRAANWSMGIFVVGIAYTLVVATGQFVFLAAYMLGAYIGTVVAVKMGAAVG